MDRLLDLLREHNPEVAMTYKNGTWTVTIGVIARAGPDFEVALSEAVGAYAFVVAPIKPPSAPVDGTKSVLAKIEALLQRAKSDSGATVEEAATCARIAQELLFKHRLSMADLATHDDPIEEQDVPIKPRPFVETWRSRLVGGVAQANGCKGIHRSGPRGVTYSVIGRRSDLSLTQYMLVYLLFQVESLCKAHSQGMGRTWANNFRLGAVDAINAKIKEAVSSVRQQAQATSQGSTALVKLDKRQVEVKQWVDDKYPNITAPTRPTYLKDKTAYEQGKLAVASIDLSKARPEP